MERTQSSYSWETTEVGRVFKLPDPVPNSRRTVKALAYREGTNGQCAWTTFNWPKYAEHTKAAGPGEK